MRYALISDIHANLPALKSVLENIAGQKDVAATYHLGDLVGYAPWPNETVQLLRAFNVPGVAGNYDSTVATDYKHCGCKYEDPRQEELSHLSYEWTRLHTSHEVKHFLGELPFRIDIRPLGGHVGGPTVTLLHGNQVLNTVYVYEDRPDSFLEKMGQAVGARSGDVVCFGHTHKPWHRVASGVHYVNTGSVGRPKDADWRAGYALLDITAEHAGVEFVRVEYDVEQVARAIIQSELPNDLAEYLKSGGKLSARAAIEGAKRG
ncbi:MAG: metallophosphoesterase family protein [Gemmatimonadaceae bacterium]